MSRADVPRMKFSVSWFRANIICSYRDFIIVFAQLLLFSCIHVANFLNYFIPLAQTLSSADSRAFHPQLDAPRSRTVDVMSSSKLHHCQCFVLAHATHAANDAQAIT